MFFFGFFFLLERATEAIAGGSPPIPSANSFQGLTNPSSPKLPGGNHPAVPEGPAALLLGPLEGKGSWDRLGAGRQPAAQQGGAQGVQEPARCDAAGGAGQGTLMEHGVVKGLPRGQAAADGFSSCLVVYIIRMLSVTFGLRFFPSSPGLPNALMFCLVDVLPA